MATFTKTFIEATPNTPILSSAWNDNIGAGRERFQNHDHNGDVDSGPQIGISGLASDVMTKFNTMQDLIDALTARVDVLEAAVNTPEITGFVPNSVAAGGGVTISGANFDPVPANNVVRFWDGGAIDLVGTVTDAAVDQLKVTVPVGAVSGFVSVEVNGRVAQSTAPLIIL